MTMQVDKVRLESFAEGRPKNGPTMQECIDMAKELLALRSLRSTEGKGAEIVATMHKSATETLFSKGNVPNLMGFTSQPLYATPEAAEAHVAKLTAALVFYANPEIYKPHPNGPAFDRRDVSYVARAALAGGNGG